MQLLPQIQRLFLSCNQDSPRALGSGQRTSAVPGLVLSSGGFVLLLFTKFGVRWYNPCAYRTRGMKRQRLVAVIGGVQPPRKGPDWLNRSGVSLPGRTSSWSAED